MMKKNLLVLGVVIALVFLGACTAEVAEEASEEETEDDTIVDLTDEVSEVVEFDVVARQYEFEPSEITVSEGDTVILHVTSEDVDHGVAISEFGVSEDVLAGETVDIQFVADTAGEYSISCSVYCGSGHLGMSGTLVVE